MHHQPMDQFIVFFQLVPLFLCIASFLLITSRSTSSSSTSRKPTLHGVPAFPLVGHLPALLKKRHCFLDWSTELLAASPVQTIGFWIPGQHPRVITADPANVEHLLHTNFNNYPKGPFHTAVQADFFGRAIFNSDGESWRWQRKSASLQFASRSLRAIVDGAVRSEIVDRLMLLLSSANAAGAAVDLQDVMERFGVDIVCMAAFGCDPGCLAADKGSASGFREFIAAYNEAQDTFLLRLLDPLWKIKKALNVGSERRFKDAMAVVHAKAIQMVHEMKQKMADNHISEENLLTRFMANPEHSDHDELFRDVVVSFLAAGRDTVSSALTWFFWRLSTRPDVETKILDEIRATRANSGLAAGEPFGFAELRGMHYLHAAITESIRLCPPVPMDTVQSAAEDVLLEGTFVGNGWLVSYSAYAMGKSEKIWGKDCMEFRVERWLDDAGEFRRESAYKFPAFHGGPRQCLGKELAYLQMKAVAASVVEKFHVSVVEKVGGALAREPELVLSFSVKMKGGLPVQVRKRSI